MLQSVDHLLKKKRVTACVGLTFEDMASRSDKAEAISDKAKAISDKAEEASTNVKTMTCLLDRQ